MPLVPVTGSRMKAAIVVGPFELDDFLEVSQAPRRPCPSRAAMPWYGSSTCTTPGMPGSAAHRRGIAGERDRAGRGAVIGAVAREDLLPAGEPARAILIAFSLASAPPLVKKKHVDVARRDLGQLRAQPRARLGRHERVGVGQHRRLVLDGLDHARVAVADVHAHQLAVEVEEALALGRPEVHALRAGDRNRIDARSAPTTRRSCAACESATISSPVIVAGRLGGLGHGGS